MRPAAGQRSPVCAEADGVGLRLDSDVTVKQIGLLAFDLDVERTVRLRVEAAFGRVSVDRVILIAANVPKQAILRVTVTVVAQCQQRIAKYPYP